MIYGLFSMLMLFMTDYLHISASVAGLIITLTRILTPSTIRMGQIVDKTNTKWKMPPVHAFYPHTRSDICADVRAVQV